MFKSKRTISCQDFRLNYRLYRYIYYRLIIFVISSHFIKTNVNFKWYSVYTFSNTLIIIKKTFLFYKVVIKTKYLLIKLM